MADRPLPAAYDEAAAAKNEKQVDEPKPRSVDDADTSEGGDHRPKKDTLKRKILRVIWDSLDKSPEERRFVAKADWWIMTYVCVAYFVKYLDQTNVSTFSLLLVAHGSLYCVGRSCHVTHIRGGGTGKCVG